MVNLRINFHSMRTTLILLAITCGILLPYGHDYTFLIHYLLILMLFFSFLDITIDKKIVTHQHFIILPLIIVIATILFFIIRVFNFDAAAAVFIAAIGPTAIAAPVIISIKKGNVGFVLFALVLNNLTIALLIPFLLPFLMGSDLNISVSQILLPVLLTFLIPFAAANGIKYLSDKTWNYLVKIKGINFYLLILNIYLATSKASYYIMNESPDHYNLILLIGILIAVTCTILFSTGRLIGGKKHPEEASFSLGQKNNGFTIWLALTYMNPVSVIGPIFYVLFQNIYISYKLYLDNKLRKQTA